MTDRPTPWRKIAAVATATVCMLIAGCSSDSSPDEDEPVNLEPLTQVESPETTASPSGSVTAFSSGLHYTTFDAATRSVVALSDGGANLVVFDADRLDAPPRNFALPTAAASVASSNGTILLPMDGRLGRLDLSSQEATAEVQTTEVDGNLLSATTLTDGSVAVGDDSGSIHILDASSNETRAIDGLSSVDALASTEHGLAALDRHQTSMTQVDVEGGSLGVALRAGTGAARVDTDQYGRILVTDAAGSELLVYSSDDLLLRQRFPTSAAPWAVAYDDKFDIAWVSTPGDNDVVGYTLDTGIPVEAGRFSTVRQPDSIAVDPDTGDVLVGSAAGDGLQRIPAAMTN